MGKRDWMGAGMKIREAKLDETDVELYGWKFTIYDSNKTRFFIALASTVLLVVALAVISHIANATPPLPKYGEEKVNRYYPEEVSLKTHCSEFAEYVSPTPEIIPTEVVKPISLKATVRKKTYMDYRAITRLGSRQLELQSKAWTDWQGFRRVWKYYIVALGKYHMKEIGEKFSVRFADGQTIKVITGDIKADKHMDSQNRYHLKDGSEIEFIIDETMIVDSVNTKKNGNGDIGYYFKGEIVEIRRID